MMELNDEEIKHYLKLSIESTRKMQEQLAAYNNPDDKWFDGRCNGKISAYQDVLRRIGANDEGGHAMTDLITEARKLCEKAMALEIPTERLDYSTEYVPLVDAIHIIPELCDALEKAERESGCDW